MSDNLITRRAQSRLFQLMARVAAGVSPETPDEADFATRFEAARIAKATRPVILSQNMGEQGDLSPNVATEFSLPDSKLTFPGIFDAAMSDLMTPSIGVNISKRRTLSRGRTVQTSLQSVFSPARDIVGDMNVGAAAVGPRDWIQLPEPLTVQERGEPINLQARVIVGAADFDASNTFLALRGVRRFPDSESEAQFSETERREVSAQIRGTQPDSRIVIHDVDYTDAETFTEVEFCDLNEYALLLGFASGSEWSTVDFIQDGLGHDWSNGPIPLNALAHSIGGPLAIAEGGTNNSLWRLLASPYLVIPHKPFVLNFAKRAATGGADYPANRNEADNVPRALKALLITV